MTKRYISLGALATKHDAQLNHGIEPPDGQPLQIGIQDSLAGGNQPGMTLSKEKRCQGGNTGKDEGVANRAGGTGEARVGGAIIWRHGSVSKCKIHSR
jgi:hypothetical protein